MKPFLYSALFIFSVFAITSCTQKKNPTPITEPVFEGTLLYSEGVITMDGQAIEIGTKVTDGALIQTDSNGTAEIVFGTKNIIKMGPSTSIKLELAKLNSVVSIEKGTITAVLRKLNKLDGGGLSVKTPSAVAGVRGTSFFVRVKPEEKETYVCICNGRINLALKDGTQSMVKEANHHDGTVFTGEGNDITIKKQGAGFDHGHTDKDLENLAAKIGEKMDWATNEAGASSQESGY